MATKRKDIKQIAVFDTETTGVNTEEDRIVTAFIGLMDVDGNLVEGQNWIINPGVEIPKGASDVHGITTEDAIARGRSDIGAALMEIATRLDVYDRRGIPVAIYNAPYDLTILDRELRRHVGLTSFRPPRIVIDPLVLDKALDKYRKGSRKLVDTAAHYCVPVAENAHDAEADCIMTGRVALAVLDHPRLVELPLSVIHRRTIPSQQDQMEGLRKYFQGKRDKATNADEKREWFDKAASVRAGWPWVPFEGDDA